MKQVFVFLLSVTLLLPGCALHNGLTSNANLHTTEVELSEGNFKVIARVQGSSEATFIFGIGGLKRAAMIAEARSKMLESADIIGSSKAVINETVEVRHTFFPIVRKYEVIVTAHIIEFTD